MDNTKMTNAEVHQRNQSMESKQAPPTIHIVRHGQALHNVHRGYPNRDPPLTEKGEDDARRISLPTGIDGGQTLPDLILISPMTRAIQTAMLAFPSIFNSVPFKADVQIWPELREAHDANCNKGASQADLVSKFPGFDFSRLPPEWHYPPHTSGSATLRAEAVRKRLQSLSASGHYHNIVLITHRGFMAFLVRGDRFDVCELRSCRVAAEEEFGDDSPRFGTNIDTGEIQDFGPTLLVPAAPVDAKCSKLS